MIYKDPLKDVMLTVKDMRFLCGGGDDRTSFLWKWTADHHKEEDQST
jgi:hypothetical protein